MFWIIFCLKHSGGQPAAGIEPTAGGQPAAEGQPAVGLTN